jgi:peptide/nickel transport system substrate-binding protein
LDRPRVLQTLRGPGGVVGPLTCQLLPPSIPAYRPYCPYQTGPADQPYQGRNLVKGRELAAASGTLGVPITVHQSTRFPFLVNLAEAAASTLRELGYHVEIEEIPPEHRSNNAEDPAYGTYQIFSQGGWGGDYASPANFYDNVVSCRVHNISHYCNPTIDAKAQAAQALRANDPGGWLRAWSEVDHMLTDDAALVPIENRVGVAVVSPTVGNVLSRVAFGPALSQVWVK